MTWWHALVLGIVQGLTEFLPVSSSGHLVLFQRILGLGDLGVAHAVALHLATLAAVVYVYARDVVRLFAAFAAGLVQWAGRRPPSAWKTPEGRLFWWLAAATIPTGLLGLLGEATVTGLFASLGAVSTFWLVTAAVLLWASGRLRGKRDLTDMRWGDAILIGTFQGLAIAPGLSRSGLTVTAALGRGFDPHEAARFSFLLSVPTIAGAAVLELPAWASSPHPSWPVLGLGMAAAALSGVWAIRTFVATLAGGRLRVFALYLGLLGLFVWGASTLG